MSEPAATATTPRSPWLSRALRLSTWFIAAVCFWLVFGKIEQAAARAGLGVADYLVRFFGDANWSAWLMLMIPYSCFFFLVDAHVTWRVVRWFNAPDFVLRRMLPIRASAYILSLVNEQVGKGAIMAVPVAPPSQCLPGRCLSSMVLLGMMEIYQLLLLLRAWHRALLRPRAPKRRSLLPLDRILPTVFVGSGGSTFRFTWPTSAACFFPASRLREAHMLRAFRLATSAPLRVDRAVQGAQPARRGASCTRSRWNLFNVDVAFRPDARVPASDLSCRGACRCRSTPGRCCCGRCCFLIIPEVGAFSLVMHTFFVLFNAVIGLVVPAASPIASCSVNAGESGNQPAS